MNTLLKNIYVNIINESEIKCFCCDKKLTGKKKYLVTTRDEQTVYVGPECFKKIQKNGNNGYQPPLGGPKLYPIK